MEDNHYWRFSARRAGPLKQLPKSHCYKYSKLLLWQNYLGDGSTSSINRPAEMPSRKKAKGKARKAAKAKKETGKEAEGREDEMSTIQVQERMVQLSIGNNPGIKCTHGVSELLDRRTNGLLLEFLEVFRKVVTSVAIAKEDRGVTLGQAFSAAQEATKVKYADIWSNRTKIELVSTFLVARGTQYILDDNIDQAKGHASAAYYFEDYTAVFLKEDRVLPDATKMAELFIADKHTLVKFYKKRIPCSCLDDMYKEVKSITKMGICCNRECGQLVARNTMLYCTRCRQVNYCSPECQIAHWPTHKEFCDYCVSEYKKDEIDSKRKS
jgi:hypothetical protein